MGADAAVLEYVNFKHASEAIPTIFQKLRNKNNELVS